MDTNHNFSGLQIICQIVCKPEKFCTVPKDQQYIQAKISWDK